MDITHKQAGRPSKKSMEKFVGIHITISPESYAYIRDILKEKNLEERGNLAALIDSIISDHKKVRTYKERQASKLQEELDVLS